MRKLTTPELEQLRRDKILAKTMTDLSNMHERFMSGVSSVKELFARNEAHMRRIVGLPKGDKGDKGDPGKNGKDGKDGADGRDGKDGKDGYTPIKGKDYYTPKEKQEVISETLQQIRQPEDGKDAIVDTDEIVQMVIEKILGANMLKVEHISGLRNEISSYRNQLAMRQAGQHGGGMTLVAGNNITLTPNANGTTTVTAAGGGSGSDVTTQIVTGTQSGANVEIDITQLTNFATFQNLVLVMRNQIPQTLGVTYSFASPIITVNDASAEDIFAVTYSYTS